MDKQIFVDFAKEAARVAIFGAISAVVAWASQMLGAADQTNTIVVLGTLLLKAVDRAIHEDKTVPAKGLLPF